METVSLSYRKLFSIEIWHDFLLAFEAEPWILTHAFPPNYDIRQLLDIQPTAQTLTQMNRFGIRHMSNSRGVDLYAEAQQVEADGSWKTSKPLPPDLQLHFALRITDPMFWAITNLNVQRTESDLFFFTNGEERQSTNGRLYLSNPMTIMEGNGNANRPFLLEDMVYTDERLYVCVAPGEYNFAGISDTESNTWVSFQYRDSSGEEDSPPQYITQADRLTGVGSSFLFTEENRSPGEQISFRLTDVYDRSVDLGNVPGTDFPQDTYSASEDQQVPLRHQLYLSHLPEGRYTLEVSGDREDKPFFLLGQSSGAKPFGLVEIRAGVEDAYAFFTETTEGNRRETPLRDPAPLYSMNFKSRVAEWRFFLPESTTSDPEVAGAVFPFSQQHIPFARTEDGPYLPNPMPQNLKVERTNGPNREIAAYFADVYLTS